MPITCSQLKLTKLDLLIATALFMKKPGLFLQDIIILAGLTLYRKI